MGTEGFEKLRVYCASEQLADAVWAVASRWPILARDTVGKQLVRSADSIGANIAEGHGRGTYADNKRFVRIARGSLNETRHWLRRAFIRQLLLPEEADNFKALLDALGPQLNAYLKAIGRDSSTNG
jgi:four helix bundle protein